MMPSLQALLKACYLQGWMQLPEEWIKWMMTFCDQGEEYLFTSSKPFSTSKTKLTKSSHLTIELVVSLIVNNEEHLLRELVDTGAINSILQNRCH
jgi:hypothetical protein